MTPPGTPPLRARRGLAALFRRRGPAGPARLVDDGTFVVLARAFEVERGDAAALEQITAAGHDLGRPLLLRHVFTVDPDADVSSLLGGLEAEGYDVERPEPGCLTAPHPFC